LWNKRRQAAVKVEVIVAVEAAIVPQKYKTKSVITDYSNVEIQEQNVSFESYNENDNFDKNDSNQIIQHQKKKTMKALAIIMILAMKKMIGLWKLLMMTLLQIQKKV